MAEGFYDRYRAWQGSAEALAAAGQSILTELGLPDPDTSARMVRFYVQQGVIAPPARQGRQALFRFRQLLQLLATRQLQLVSHMPLAMIARHLGGLDEEALLALLPRPVPPGGQGEAQPAIAGLLARAAEQATAELAMQEDLRRLGSPAAAVAQAEVTELQIAPGCRLSLDARFLARLSMDELDALARTCRTLLTQAMQARSARAAALARPAGLHVPAPVPPTRKLVLFVNDQPDADLDIWNELAARGATVLRALSTGEALALLARAQPDAVITDLARQEGTVFNGMAGIELVRGMRERGSQAPAIVYTNRKPEGVHALVATLGACDITESPSRLRQWLREQGI